METTWPIGSAWFLFCQTANGAIRVTLESGHLEGTVDGRNPAPVERQFNSLFTGFYTFLYVFIHLRWCRISSINTITTW